MTRPLLTTAEAAALLRVHPKTLLLWNRQHRFPTGVVLRAGSRVLFDRDSLLRWAGGTGLEGRSIGVA